MHVVVTCKHLQRDRSAYLDLFDEAGLSVSFPDIPGQELAGEALVAAMDGAAGVIAGDDAFDREVLQQLPDLRVIAKWGIGLDGIDQHAASELGIAVTNTPGMFNDEVAEMALGYLFSSARGIVQADRAVRNGGWPNKVGITVTGKSVIVVGLGNIGAAFATKALALGLVVTAVDPSEEAKQRAGELGIGLTTLSDGLPAADFVVVTCPLTPETEGLLGTSELALLPRGAHLINVGRGPVVSEQAVIDALASGQLGGAALDVFESEPLSLSSGLRGFENCILGTHNSSNTAEACHRTHLASIANLIDGLT